MAQKANKRYVRDGFLSMLTLPCSSSRYSYPSFYLHSTAQVPLRKTKWLNVLLGRGGLAVKTNRWNFTPNLERFANKAVVRVLSKLCGLPRSCGHHHNPARATPTKGRVNPNLPLLCYLSLSGRHE